MIAGLAFVAFKLWLDGGTNRFWTLLEVLKADVKGLAAEIDSLRAVWAEQDKLLADKDSGILEQLRRIRTRMGMESR